MTTKRWHKLEFLLLLLTVSLVTGYMNTAPNKLSGNNSQQNNEKYLAVSQIFYCNDDVHGPKPGAYHEVVIWPVCKPGTWPFPPGAIVYEGLWHERRFSWKQKAEPLKGRP